jgi:predicted kinase
MTQELIVFTGNIGSGKSLIASKYAKQGYVVVNMDSITTMIQGGEYGLYDKNKREVYHRTEAICIHTALDSGLSVVVDRTNMKKSDRKRYVDIGKEYGVCVRSIDWGEGDDKSLNRRLSQPNGIPSNQWVDVHSFMKKSYEKPSDDEGFDFIMPGPTSFRFYAVDFDGTIVDNKFPEIGVINDNMVLKLRQWWELLGNIIIIWTCRSGDRLNQMKSFLLKNNIPFDFINENPIANFGSPKIYAHEYHDDRNKPLTEKEKRPMNSY